MTKAESEEPLSVAERFVSLNGEGRHAGQLACFIRFAGCNLSCSYCDTAWANAPNLDAALLSPEELRDYAVASGAKLATLTGGEPLLQPNINKLIELLVLAGLQVEIETNGSVDLTSVIDLRHRLNDFAADAAAHGATITFTMDWKLPSSGQEEHMMASNLLMLDCSDVVKFVIGDEADLHRAFQVIDEKGLSAKCGIYVSPVAGSMNPADIGAYMVEHKRSDVTLQLQLHKIIWPGQTRGV